MCWTFDICYRCGHSAPQSWRACAAFQHKHALAKTADARHLSALARNDAQCLLVSGDMEILSRELCLDCGRGAERGGPLGRGALEEGSGGEEEKKWERRPELGLIGFRAVMGREEERRNAGREGIRATMDDLKLAKVVSRKRALLRERQERVRKEAEKKGWEDAEVAVSGVESRMEEEGDENGDEHKLLTLEEWLEELRIRDNEFLELVRETRRLEVEERNRQILSPVVFSSSSSSSSSSLENEIQALFENVAD